MGFSRWNLPIRRGRVRGVRVKSQELLHISVLGKLAVLRHGTSIALPPSKRTRALLAYLAVTARPHSRDRLCTMFWNLPDDPRAALRWSLTRLRPVVDEPGCPRIIADRENVGLDLGQVAVDILSLRSIARRGVDAISTPALRHWIKTLEGDFLEGLDLPDCKEFQSWCIGARDEARRLRVRLLTALITQLEGIPEDALPHARALTLLEPANESVHATLLRLLRTTGRLGEAEEHFERAQQQLAEFAVTGTGVLRQAAQLPHWPNPSARPDHLATPRPNTGRLCAGRALHDVRFSTTSDHVRIAYACVGDGPPLVWAAHWLSHLSFSWESPIWRHWTEEFAKDHAFVHYDERGSGLSDWTNAEFSLDACVRDLEAVVDALGLERFALIGSSKGGPTSIAYAARHPERVSQLVLYGTFAQGWRTQGNDSGIERREAMITLVRQGWAQDNPAIRQMLTSLFVPDAALEEMGWFNELQRLSSSAENAARLMRAVGDFNVLDLLPSIAAPALVLHCRDDAAVPFEQGQLIASRIPGAGFVALEGRNHILLPRDPAWTRFVREVRQFLKKGTRPLLRAQRAGTTTGGDV
jgi:DNA-binding SARP family transcriptional activator/pimeloyl-ACP methyl ester carboxylesterase